jgi:hypothetical protein
MISVLPATEQVTPAWLTAVLKRHHLLRHGEVRALEHQPTSAFNSHTLHLHAAFSDDVPPGVPNRFVLKRNLKEPWAIRSGVQEATLYQTVPDLPDHPPVIVPCYEAVVDAATGNSHILLLDLSDTHMVPLTRDQQLDVGNNVPLDVHLDQAVDALAQFHAFWWQHPRLGSGVAQIGTWCSDEAHMTNEVERRRRAWNDLRAHEVAWFPPHLTALYEVLLPQLFRLWHTYTRPRLASFAHLTLTHGDAYLNNYLCPRPGQPGATYLIDWQSPEVYRSTSDVVTMCATFWTRTQRADRERYVLQRYHRGLHAHGVTGYSWDDLIKDYQYSIIDWLLIPLQDRLDGAGTNYWFPKMQCLADAFEDWNCASLWAHG